MTRNHLFAIERLVEDYGWDVVIDELMTEAKTAPEDELEELEALIDAAIVIGGARGEVFS
jgi:hypothetical protein